MTYIYIVKSLIKKKELTQEFGVVVNGSFLLKMVLKVLMGFVLIFCVE